MSTKTIALLRHAKAERESGSDHERDLDEAGRAQCAALAQVLSARGLTPQAVLCSDAARTVATWRLLSRAMPQLDPQVRVTESLYLGDVADILDAIAEVGEDIDTVLVVAHEPGVSETAYHLADDDYDLAALAQVRSGLPTAGLALLSTSARWDALDNGSASLTEVLRG